jgi:purine-binding chemotaxis protein CheW
LKEADLQASEAGNVEAGEIALVCFSVGETKYAAVVASICEVIRMVEITPVPDAPSFIAGIINLRGEIIPVIDLRKRLGVPSVSYGTNTVILIAEIDGKKRGVVVDGVSSVLSVPLSAVDFADTENGQSLGDISGAARLPDGVLVILDLCKLLDFEEKEQLELVAGGVNI